MAAPTNINEILAQVKKLDKDEQLNLLHRLVSLLKKEENSEGISVRLTSLAGLGSNLWRNVDIDKYIEDERQW